MQYLPPKIYMNMTYFTNKYFLYLPTSKPDTLHIYKKIGKWDLLQFL